MNQKYHVQVSMNQAAIVKTGLVWKQGDFGFQVEIEVLDFDTSGTTPQIVFRKSAGAVESTDVSVVGNVYTYTFKGTELDVPGVGICDLKLKNSTTQRISTASFMFKVVADTLDGLAEESSSYSDTIAQIVGGFDDDIEKLNDGLESGWGDDIIIDTYRANLQNLYPQPNNTFSSSGSNFLVFTPCEPNETYRIERIYASTNMFVCTSANPPSNGSSFLSKIDWGSSDIIELTTTADTNYFIIGAWNSTLDAQIDKAEYFSGITVHKRMVKAVFEKIDEISEELETKIDGKITFEEITDNKYRMIIN